MVQKRSHTNRSHKHRSWALSVAATLALLTLNSPVRAEEEGTFVKTILGSIGIIDEDKAPIEYRERAPLVVPPNFNQLPAPKDPAAVSARNPAWPTDPDVVDRKRRAADARRPATNLNERIATQGAVLSIDEIRAGRRPGAEIPRTPSGARGDNAREELWVHPDVLRSQGRIKDDQAVADSGERRYLTDPPSAYRRTTGQPLKPTVEPVTRPDEADPRAFIRQQAGR